MGNEIERRYLVDNSNFVRIFNDNKLVKSEYILQGYLLTFDSIVEHRVRLTSNSVNYANSFFTVKTKSNGLCRKEYEMNISYYEAVNMIKDCELFLFKHRYLFEMDNGLIFELNHLIKDDMYIGEIEFETVRQAQLFNGCLSGLVIGRDVTDNPSYKSYNLTEQLSKDDLNTILETYFKYDK